MHIADKDQALLVWAGGLAVVRDVARRQVPELGVAEALGRVEIDGGPVLVAQAAADERAEARGDCGDDERVQRQPEEAAAAQA